MSAERRAQAGGVLVEVALALPLFLALLCALFECARLVYLRTTLQEVARVAARGAAVTDFSSAAAMAALRRRALLRDSDGPLPLGGPIDAAYIRIEYLRQDAAGALQPVAPASMPASPAQNLHNCVRSPSDAGCIRFVRASICQPQVQAECAAVPYPALAPLAWSGPALPTSASLARAESLGYRAGAPLP